MRPMHQRYEHLQKESTLRPRFLSVARPSQAKKIGPTHFGADYGMQVLLSLALRPAVHKHAPRLVEFVANLTPIGCPLEQVGPKIRGESRNR